MRSSSFSVIVSLISAIDVIMEKGGGGMHSCAYDYGCDLANLTINSYFYADRFTSMPFIVMCRVRRRVGVKVTEQVSIISSSSLLLSVTTLENSLCSSEACCFRSSRCFTHAPG